MEFDLKIKITKDFFTGKHYVETVISYFDYKELLTDTVIRKKVVGKQELDLNKELQKLNEDDFNKIMELVKSSAEICFRNTLVSSQDFWKESGMDLVVTKAEDFKVEIDDTIV